MPEPLVRGHVLLHTAAYFSTQCDRPTNQRFEAEISSALRADLHGVVPSGWYPREHEVELLKTLVAIKGTGDAAYADLVRCGAAMLTTENEFMRLLMKVLTPDLLLKKLPKFWTRDHRASGAVELESLEGQDRGARIRLYDVAGYDHAAIVWLGWLKRALEVLAGPRAEVKQSGWSWSSPSPEEVIYEVRWS